MRASKKACTRSAQEVQAATRKAQLSTQKLNLHQTTSKSATTHTRYPGTCGTVHQLSMEGRVHVLHEEGRKEIVFSLPASNNDCPCSEQRCASNGATKPCLRTVNRMCQAAGSVHPVMTHPCQHGCMYQHACNHATWATHIGAHQLLQRAAGPQM